MDSIQTILEAILFFVFGYASALWIQENRPFYYRLPGMARMLRSASYFVQGTKNPRRTEIATLFTRASDQIEELVIDDLRTKAK